jgi:hypothetical protein
VLRVGDSLRIEALGKDCGKRALANAYGPFYRYIPGEIEKLGHECEKVAFENIPSASLAQLSKKLTANAEGRIKNSEFIVQNLCKGASLLHFDF